MVHNDIDSYHVADRERVSKIVQFLANTASSTTSNITNLLILWSIFVGERFSMCQHSEQLCTHTLTAHTGRAHNSLYSVSMSAIIHDSAFHWNGALFHSIQMSAGRIHSQLTYITFAIAHLFCVCFPLRFFFSPLSFRRVVRLSMGVVNRLSGTAHRHRHLVLASISAKRVSDSHMICETNEKLANSFETSAICAWRELNGADSLHLLETTDATTVVPLFINKNS